MNPEELTTKKPPLGLMPREAWERAVTKQRAAALVQAMFRYSNEDKSIPLEWFVELEQIIERLP